MIFFKICFDKFEFITSQSLNKEMGNIKETKESRKLENMNVFEDIFGKTTKEKLINLIALCFSLFHLYTGYFESIPIFL